MSWKLLLPITSPLACVEHGEGEAVALVAHPQRGLDVGAWRRAQAPR